VLVDLSVVEQRYKAVLEVLNDGASVSDVARGYGGPCPPVANFVWKLRQAAVSCAMVRGFPQWK
jgi:hypothetical protein